MPTLRKRRENEHSDSIAKVLTEIGYELKELKALLAQTKNAVDPIAQQQSATQNPQSPPAGELIRVIAEASDTEKAERNANERKHYSLQRKGLWIQGFLCLFTLGAFGAAWWYASIARGQLDAMDKTLADTHTQTVAQGRALLVVEGDPIRLESDQVAIRFRNRGRTAAKILRVVITLDQVIYGKRTFKQNSIAPNVTVTVEEPSVLGIWMPKRPALPVDSNGRYITGRWILSATLSIYVAYDDGFGNREPLNSCFVYNPIDRSWAPRCMSVNDIDLSKAPSTPE